MAADGLGNVVLSRPFQFAEIQTAHPTVTKHNVIWTASALKSLTPIRARWIYAFELGEHDVDQKPILAAEYHADANGRLGFVPGLKRRAVEATDKGAPTPLPVPAAALPVARQGKPLRHAFVATRGRMGKRAIAEMENDLHPIYQRFDLADDDHFQHAPSAPKGPLFLPIIDPLTLGESLHVAYETALNEAINFAVVHKNNPKAQEVEISSRKYQLAKMIKDTLLAPEGELTDPLNLDGHIAGGARTLINFVEEHEAAARKLDWNRRRAARDLILLLTSDVWGTARQWYQGTPQADGAVGHFFLDATLCCLDRLSETPEGRRFEEQLIADREQGLLSYVFEPDEAASEAVKEQRLRRFAVARKAATGVVLAIAEFAPALVVYRKGKAAATIQRSLKAFLTKTNVSVVLRTPNGRVAQVLKVTHESLHIDVDFKQAKVDLEKWIEDGKPHWPEGTTLAKASELLARLFIGVEAVNLYNEVNDLKEGKGEPLKVIGAVLDLAVAAEDPIRALARQLGPRDTAREGASELAHAEVSAGMREAAIEASEQEAKSLLGKLVAPAAFKFLGAASAVIDVYFNFKEAGEAEERGDLGVMVGKKIVAGGSTLLLLGSLFNAVGYASKLVLFTAASATVLVIGLVVVAVGLAVIAHFGTSSWQKFAQHSCFGIYPAKDGHEKWSGGNFSAWKETADGIDRQIEVFTTMLCSFKVAGVGFDAAAIAISFGAIPPNAILEVEFTIAYDNGQTRTPVYLVDLQTAERTYRGDATTTGTFAPYWSESRIHSILLGADRPANLRHARIERSSCSVIVRYARDGVSKGSASTGTIPIYGPCKYRILDGIGMVQLSEFSSLDVGDE